MTTAVISGKICHIAVKPDVLNINCNNKVGKIGRMSVSRKRGPPFIG